MSAGVTEVQPDSPAVTASGKGKGLLRQSLRYHRTKVGLVFTGAVVLLAIAGPLVAPYSTTEFVGQPFFAHTADAVLGTDNLGRDVLSRFLGGGRSVLLFAVLATVLGVGVGVVVALVAGYTRSWIDELLMRFSDIVLAFPQIVLALLFLSVWGPQPWVIVVTVGLSHAPRTARIIRSAVLGVAGRDYVRAAEAIGLRRWPVRVGDLLPNVTGPLMVETGLRFTYSIGLVAGLGFLGLGLQPPAADWGLMINENRIGLVVQPWAVLLPVAAIGLIAVGTNLISDGIAQASAGLDREVEG
ncbi:MAG: ABC transporter permease subunit [Streptosporangiales bacterium]|nr:ABC transporter permease subunit [Streptosporangiales bacterium]